MVIAAAAADKNPAAGTLGSISRITGAFQGVPAFLKEDPLLRIHIARLCARNVKECWIKLIDFIQKAAVATSNSFWESPACNRPHTGARVGYRVPIGRKICRPCITPAHTNDGDGIIVTWRGVSCFDLGWRWGQRTNMRLERR